MGNISQKQPLRTRAQDTADGQGVKIKRNSLIHQPLADPFLLLDELASDNPDDFIGGFPRHPHRGIQTITLMLKGGFRHEDHLGNQGEITAGGVQWMSAGRGIEHSEMPTQSSRGIHGFQLWLNLPAADKFSAPQWRDISAGDIPQISQPHFQARLIAGLWQFDCTASPMEGALQGLPGAAAIADIAIAAGQPFSYQANANEQLLFYAYAGNSVDSLQLGSQQMLYLGLASSLTLTASNEGLRGLLLKGEPLNEPIANWGPFVMNNEAQVQRAIKEYGDGSFLQVKEDLS